MKSEEFIQGRLQELADIEECLYAEINKVVGMRLAFAEALADEEIPNLEDLVGEVISIDKLPDDEEGGTT